MNPAHKDLIADDRDTCCLPLCKHYTCLGLCDFLEAASRKRTHHYTHIKKTIYNDGFNRNLFFFAGVHFADAMLLFWCVAPAKGVLLEARCIGIQFPGD